MMGFFEGMGLNTYVVSYLASSISATAQST